MRSASLSTHAARGSVTTTLTDVEKPFRNAKLRRATLITYKAFADVAARGALFVITIVAARRLSAYDFGVFGLGTTIGWMLAVATDFGVQMHLARAVAQSPAHALAHLDRWWRFRVAAAAAGIVALVVGMWLLGVSRSTAVPLALFSIVYTAASLVELLNYFYRGLSRSDIESTLTIGHRAATLVLAIGVLVYRPGLNLLALAMLLPIAVALLWSARAAGRQAAPAAAMARPTDTFFGDVFPIGLGIVLSALYFRIDVLLVQLWSGTEAVATYNAVFRLIDALRLFPAAVLAVMFPAFARAESLQPVVRVATAMTVFGFLVAAALWLIADRVVPLAFGSRYATGVPAFRVLILAFPLLCLNFALTHQLVGWGRQRAYALICAAALVVNVALNAWLIPSLAIEGAAWATLGTELCLTAGCVAALGARA